MATRNKRSTLPKAGKQSTVPPLKEGSLYKRQRGQSRTDLRGLTFQQRQCRLTTTSFEYYSNKKEHPPSGQYQVAQIKIVEKVPDKTFRKRPRFCFQIGNKDEVMYFSANSDQDRNDWIEAFRIAAFELRSNTKLSHYHLGAFGQLEQNKWSCCNKGSRTADGCEPVTQYNDGTRKRQSSLPPQPCTSGEDPLPPISLSAISQSLPTNGFLNDETDRDQYKPSYSDYDDSDTEDCDTGSTQSQHGGKSNGPPYPGTGSLHYQESSGPPYPGTAGSLHYQESDDPIHSDTGTTQSQFNEESMSHLHPDSQSVQSLRYEEPMGHQLPTDDAGSFQSLDSGMGNSNLDLTTVSSPAGARRNTYHAGITKRRSHDSILKDGTILEENIRPESSSPTLSWIGPEVYVQRAGSPLQAIDSPPVPSPDNSPTVKTKLQLDHDLIYSMKTVIEPGSRHESEISAVVYKGADKLVAATSDGHVFTSNVNMNKPTETIAFRDSGKVTSLSVWGKFVALGSDKIHLMDMDHNKTKLLYTREIEHNQKELFSNLVSFSPDGSLFSATKDSNTLHIWSHLTKRWSDLESPTKPVCTLKLGGDTDRIFSLSVCPHPEQPWFAVGLTSGKDSLNHLLVYNYETKERLLDIETGVSGRVHSAFAHDGKYLFFSCDKTLKSFDLSSKRVDDFKYTQQTHPNKGLSITSMCSSSVRHHLAVGLSNGDVKVFVEESPEREASPYTFAQTKTNQPAAVTSLTYSRDGMKTAVGFADGSIQIWKGSRPPRDEPVVWIKKLTVDSKGLTYTSPTDGFSITIPEGAVKEDCSVSLKCGVAPHGPFGPYKFEDRVQPVSAILSLCPTPADTVFLKPIQVTLTHFLSCDTSEDCDKIAFYKARHDDFKVEDGEKIYRFKKVTDGKMVPFSCYINYHGTKAKQGAVTLYTDHCCDLCITSKVTEEETEKAIYNLCQAIPKNRDMSKEWNIEYCLHYFLPTCDKMYSSQFPDELYDVTRNIVKFNAQCDPLIKIHFPEERLDGGWLLELKSPANEIHRNDVCFWMPTLRPKIAQLCLKKLYPPRIVLGVVPGEPTQDKVVVRVSFSGAVGCVAGSKPSFPLLLAKPMLSPGSSSNQFLASPTLQSSRSRNSSQVDVQDAVDSFQDCFHEIAKVAVPAQLVSALFSASSKKKLPNIDRSHLKVISSSEFLEKANCPSGQEHKTNVKILTDVWGILDKAPEYIVAVHSALDKVLPDSAQNLKEQLGCRPSRKHSRQGSEVSLTQGYITAPESLVPSGGSGYTPVDEDPLSATVFNSESVGHVVGNGYLPHMRRESTGSYNLNNGPLLFSNPTTDPSV